MMISKQACVEFFNDTSIGFLTLAEDGTIIESSPGFVRMVGHDDPMEIQHRKIVEFFTLGSRIYYETIFLPLLLLQKSVREVNFEIHRKDKTRLPVLINSTMVAEHPAKSVIRIIVVDISFRKKYEQELLEEKRKVESLLTDLRQSHAALADQTLVIETQKQELERLNAVKDKFFRIVAHDLKSPLNSLMAYTQLMIDHAGKIAPEQFKQMNNQLQATVKNTVQMVDNLNTWARLKMQDIVILQQPVLLHNIVDEIVKVYEPVAQKKGITITTSINNNLTTFVDKDQLRFVVRNLIDNAVKYTHPNRSITILSEQLDQTYFKLTIHDGGDGLPENFDQMISELMVKKSQRGTSGEEGTGFGLMLSFEFARENGFKITYQNSPAGGAEFNVILHRHS